MLSLAPFLFTGERIFAILPISVWAFYNFLFVIGGRRANLVVPGFGTFERTFKASVEEFFSPRYGISLRNMSLKVILLFDVPQAFARSVYLLSAHPISFSCHRCVPVCY